MAGTPLPNALVIGPMRCGTTWLDRYLRSHDDVCLPKGVKETFFFDRRFSKGIEWYAQHFHTCGTQAGERICEVGPSYFHCPEAPERISDTLGHVKLVVIVRNPVERAYSHYLHLRRYGFTSLPLRSAVDEQPEILDGSRYAAQLERWLTHHDAEDIHLVSFRTLKRNSTEFVAGLTDILDVRTEPIPEALSSATNRGRLPRSPLAARIGWKVSDYLRERRLHWVVETAKKLGLKRVFFAGREEDRKPGLDENDREWLYEQLSDDFRRWPEMGLEPSMFPGELGPGPESGTQ